MFGRLESAGGAFCGIWPSVICVSGASPWAGWAKVRAELRRKPQERPDFEKPRIAVVGECEAAEMVWIVGVLSNSRYGNSFGT